jgi:hypothetical protein
MRNLLLVLALISLSGSMLIVFETIKGDEWLRTLLLISGIVILFVRNKTFPIASNKNE